MHLIDQKDPERYWSILEQNSKKLDVITVIEIVTCTHNSPIGNKIKNNLQDII